MRQCSRQLELRPRTWGGKRPGAGRKPSGRRVGVPHRRRVAHHARHPLHVTMRARRGLGSLRNDAVFLALRRGLGKSSRGGFRILHFSVQRDHVHLIVEADDGRARSRGVQGLAIRLAKTVNRVLRRRGAVWSERYHARALRTPREVRNALVYVLQNWRKHLPAARGVDPRSSGAWFQGWVSPVPEVGILPPVAAARSWLAGIGWRRLGRISVDERPVGQRPKRRAVARKSTPTSTPVDVLR